jgi:DNA-binding sugar fermentation-stimulating protein
MSIPAAKLPPPPRDVRKKGYRAAAMMGFQKKNVSDFSAATVLDPKYS